MNSEPFSAAGVSAYQNLRIIACIFLSDNLTETGAATATQGIMA